MKAKQKPGVVFQPQVQRRMQRGIQTMVGAISPTLGPLSSGVAIDHLNKSIQLPEFLDNGGLIARRIIELPNRDEDMGAMLVRSMLVRQHERVGDGVATAAVLLEAIFNGGVRYLAAGGNAMRLRHYMEQALPLILDRLEQMVFRLEGQAALTALARSLCHEDEMAALFGEAFDLVGAFGRLEIREDYGRTLRRELVEGTYYYTGLCSTALLPAATRIVTFENPAIFLCDFEIEDHHDLFPVLQTAHAAGVKQLVIVARRLSEAAISLLVANNRMDSFKAMAVTLPGANPTERMESLDDLGKLTGATPFIQVTGQTLDKVSAGDFGRARRVWADNKTFGIIGAGGSPIKLREHLHSLKTQFHRAPDPKARERLLERITALSGSSVTLWVGGFTKTEIDARKSLAQRTALAMRTSLQEGVVAGGGVALLNCRAVLECALTSACDSDERAAYRILIDALEAPARTLYRNSGYDPGEVLSQIAGANSDAVFDVVTDQIVNVHEAGIVDSARIVATSVRNAVTTAALALTIDSLVHVANPEIIARPE